MTNSIIYHLKGTSYAHRRNSVPFRADRHAVQAGGKNQRSLIYPPGRRQSPYGRSAHARRAYVRARIEALPCPQRPDRHGL